MLKQLLQVEVSDTTVFNSSSKAGKKINSSEWKNKTGAKHALLNTH